ncbi:hypothetical protein IJ098_02905 [Candidatus Saccharibacteria bacterium]|nr:hypothetical protein [Candidatus Saccharibacteria bacterium]
MVFAVSEVSGIGDYSEHAKTLGSGDDAEEVTIFNTPNEKTFLVVRKNTLEVRTDAKLRDLLREKYETVMESRYFGKGGVEIVNSGQLTTDELNDLVRLSYNLSTEITE